MMKIIVGKDGIDMASTAARDAAQSIRNVISARGEARVIFATGASQMEFLQALVREPGIDWAKVCGFHLDEYKDIPESHPASFRKYIKERLVAQMPVYPKSFTFVGGDAPDVEAELDRLEKLLREKPIDIACIGIGENGHIAFNDPPADFNTTRAYSIVNLDQKCRMQQVGEGWFKTLEQVPTQAYSMTVPEIMKSEKIICVVPDERKADAVKGAVEGPVTNLHPSSILQQHPDCVLYLDPSSASELKR